MEIAAVKMCARLYSYGFILLALKQAHSVYFCFHGYLLGSRIPQVGML